MTPSLSLVEKIGRAGFQHPLSSVLLTLKGQTDYNRVWVFSLDQARRLDAIHHRHSDIHHNQVGTQFADALHRLQTVFSLADHLY